MTRYIQRHSRLARVTHGVAAVSCIFLALTGVAVFTPAISEALGGTFVYWMRMLHRIAAVPFILFPLIALVRSPKGAAHLFKNNIFGKWDKDDWEVRALPLQPAEGSYASAARSEGRAAYG